MSKILLTGGSGFIGKKLLQNHLFKEALAIGRTNPGKGIKFIKVQLTEYTDYSELLSDIDVIVHLAGRAHVINDKDQDALDEYIKINTLATLNLARQAMQSGVKRFVFISSVKVLGDNTEVGKPFISSDPLNPKNSYSISKAKAEVDLIKLCRNSSMDFVIVRPPLVYGPNVKGNFKTLLQLVKMRVPLPFGAVKNKRSMISINNLIDFICVCLTAEKAKNKIFLVSDDFDLSIKELLDMLSKSKNYKSLVFRFPLNLLKLTFFIIAKSKIYEKLCLPMQVDITETKTHLNWKPPFSIQESLNELWRKDHKEV